MSAIFAIDQARPGPSAGTPGEARNDLWLGWQIDLRCTTVHFSYQWLLIDAPPGSTATILNGSSQIANFTPDVAGSYRVMLIVDGGGPGNTMILICAVRYDHSGTQLNRGWRLPALGEQAPENNFGGQVRSWAEAWEYIIPDLLNFMSSFNPTLLGDVNGAMSASVVVGIQSRPVLSTAPSAGQFLGWDGSHWAPATVVSFTAGGDLSGSSSSQTVVGLQGRPLSSSAPATGQLIGWDGATWKPVDITTLQTRPVSSSAPATGQFLGWNGAAWAPSTSIGSYTLTAGGIDSATSLGVGTTSATSVTIGRSGVTTTINGNLVINGTVTEIESTVVDISDRVIHLNWAPLAIIPVPTHIAGIDIDRGSADGVTPRDSAGLFWDEGSSRWKAAFNTAADETTLGAFLDFQVNNFYTVAIIATGAISGTNLTASGTLKGASLQVTGLTSGVLGVDGSGNAVKESSLPLPVELTLLAYVANISFATATRVGSRYIDLSAFPTTLADGRSLVAKFVVDIETTAGTANVLLKNITDNETVTSSSFSTSNLQSTEFTGTLTVGSSSGNLKTGKLYEVQLSLSGGGSLDRATCTHARIVLSYA